MSQTPDEIQADIQRQRDALATTVDQLTDKLDVKSHAKRKVNEVTNKATTDDGKPGPELIGAAAGTAVALVVLAIWRRKG